VRLELLEHLHYVLLRCIAKCKVPSPPSKPKILYAYNVIVCVCVCVYVQDVLVEVVRRERDMNYVSMLKKLSGVDHTKEDRAGEEAGKLDQILVGGGCGFWQPNM